MDLEDLGIIAVILLIIGIVVVLPLVVGSLALWVLEYCFFIKVNWGYLGRWLLGILIWILSGGSFIKIRGDD